MRVQWGPTELQIIRLNSIDVEAKFDPTGMDYLFTAITLDLSFVWHPFATSSNTGGAGVPPFDQIGVSLQTLREQLSYPRQLLAVSIGGKLVWSAPGLDPLNPPNRFPCDVGGGPFPQLLSLMQIEGEYGAMGRWRVTFHKRYANGVLMSNRWQTRTITNDAALTTRVTSGVALMRLDMVGYQALVPPAGIIDYINVDDFRSWCFLPVPAGFRRSSVDVTVTERGDKMKYTVVDVEDPNPMGSAGAGIIADKFDGGATTGSSVSIKSWKEMASNLLHVNIEAVMMSCLTDTMATAWAKVWGGKSIPKSRLLDRALQICLDRANSNLGGVSSFFFAIMSVVVSQGVGESEQEGRWVRAEIAWRPPISAAAGNTVHIDNVKGQLNWSNDVTPINIPIGGGVPPAVASTFPGDVPAIFPGVVAPLIYYNSNFGEGVRVQRNGAGLVVPDGGSRGTWIGALLVQALQAPFGATAPPSAPRVGDIEAPNLVNIV